MLRLFLNRVLKREIGFYENVLSDRSLCFRPNVLRNMFCVLFSRYTVIFCHRVVNSAEQKLSKIALNVFLFLYTSFFLKRFSKS